MLKRKTLDKFAKLLAEVNRVCENGDKDFAHRLSPEVENQAAVIESCLYGLLDRMAYAHLDRNGKPIHVDRKTSRAFQETVEAVRENEGEKGNSDTHWFNILTRYPEGTMDGVLKLEHDVMARIGK